jgi:DNA replication licensing factor MCM4
MDGDLEENANAAGNDPAAHENEEEDEEGEGATLIRGTDVHVQSAAEAFRDFLRNFVSVAESERLIAKDDEDDASMEEEREKKPPMYLSKLEEILLKGRTLNHSDSLTSNIGNIGVASLDLDALHLYFHSPACQRLYGWLVDYPAEIVPLMDILVGRELESLREDLKLKTEERMANAELNGDQEEVENATAILELLPSILPRVQVRPYHLRNLAHMRSLDPQSIDTLLSIRGMVVRTSPIIPDLKVAFFQCTICGSTEQITIDRGRITEPTNCPTCHVKHGYSMVHNRCYFSDKQMVRVQETPDEVPAGETPASIVIFAYDDLVDAVR